MLYVRVRILLTCGKHVHKTLSEQFKNPIEKIVGRGKIDTTNAHIHDRSLSWLGIYTSKKVAGLSCFCGPLLVR